MTTPDPEQALVESLRLARRELKLARGEQEAAVETLQRVRRQRHALRDEVRLYSDALADLLSKAWWADQQSERTRPGLLRRRTSGPEPAADAEADPALVAEVEAASGFDAGSYLRQHPELIAEGISPAVHYVRSGGRARHDAGPDVDTAQG
jgi:hypothetical protein